MSPCIVIHKHPPCSTQAKSIYCSSFSYMIHLGGPVYRHIFVQVSSSNFGMNAA